MPFFFFGAGFAGSGFAGGGSETTGLGGGAFFCGGGVGGIFFWGGGVGGTAAAGGVGGCAGGALNTGGADKSSKPSTQDTIHKEESPKGCFFNLIDISAGLPLASAHTKYYPKSGYLSMLCQRSNVCEY